MYKCIYTYSMIGNINYKIIKLLVFKSDVYEDQNISIY